jgi:hypothetical protein
MKPKQKQTSKGLWIRIALVLGVFIGLSISGFALDCKKTEEGNLEITYDPLNQKTFCNDFVVDYGKNVTFKVTNVNPFLYKVTIDAKTFDYLTEIPKEFFQIPSKKTEAETDDITNKISDKIAESFNTEEKMLVALKDKGKKEIKMQSLGIKKQNFDRDMDRVRAFREVYNKLIKVTGFLNSLSKEVLKIKSYIDLKDILNKLMSLLWPNENLTIAGALGTFNMWYVDAENKYEAINFNWLETQGNDPESKQLAEQLKTYKKNLHKMKKEKVIDSIADLLNKLSKENLERSVLVCNVDSDEVQFTVKIEPLDKEKTPILHEILNPIRVKVKGGWTINFSTGVLVDINFRDYHYQLKDVENQEGKVSIEKKQDTTINPTPVVFMHAYLRWTGRSGWGGFSLGIGTKDSKQLTYYFGTSWMFGRKQRFILNVGASLANRDVLKPEYEVNQVLEQNENLKPENLVEQKYRFGLYFGISYNLTKPKTESDSKPKPESK